MALAFGYLKSQIEWLLLPHHPHFVGFLSRPPGLFEHQVFHLQVFRHKEILKAEYLGGYAEIIFLFYHLLYIMDGLAVSHFMWLQNLLTLM